jgi:hypothetical protein
MAEPLTPSNAASATMGASGGGGGVGAAKARRCACSRHASRSARMPFNIAFIGQPLLCRHAATGSFRPLMSLVAPLGRRDPWGRDVSDPYRGNLLIAAAMSSSDAGPYSCPMLAAACPQMSSSTLSLIPARRPTALNVCLQPWFGATSGSVTPSSRTHVASRCRT